MNSHTPCGPKVFKQAEANGVKVIYTSSTCGPLSNVSVLSCIIILNCAVGSLLTLCIDFCLIPVMFLSKLFCLSL